MTFDELKEIDLETVELTQDLYDELVNNSSLGIRLPVVKALKRRTDINDELFSKLEFLTKRQYSSKFMSSMSITTMIDD